MNSILDRLKQGLADRYLLVREIGAGGMATVYLARDVRHDRQVALKLLSPELGAVLGSERFLAEIRVTANLQHPHLLPLFDSGESGGLLYYVMPYIEGESLRARLDREKQLPVDEAIRITVAAAGALDYAHRHGVVHRDLKPENILLHDGQPLVSDFGIALAISNAGGARVTQTGLSLGTPAYMSPEQATGDRTIDARSDIYSLAAVLYELLTGEPPHTGATVQAIIARVLTDKPRSVRATRDTVPPHVDAALQKALAKLPADRFATAQQFADALQNPRITPTVEVTGAETSGVGPARGGSPRRLAPSVAPWLVAAAALVAAAVGWLRNPTQTDAVTARFPIGLPEGMALATGVGSGFGISPDGRMVVFSATVAGHSLLHVRSVGDVQVRPLAGTEGGAAPFFSPDGESIGFYVPAEERIKRIPATGGTVLIVATSTRFGGVTRFGGATWGANNVIVFGGPVGAPLMQVDANGGEVRAVTKLDALDARHGAPHFLPDGKTLVFVRMPTGGPILAVATLDGRVRDLDLTGYRPQYVRSGYLLFNSPDANVVAVRFDSRSQTASGRPVLVLPGVRVGPLGNGVWSASPNGTLVYDAGSTAGRLAIVDRSGRTELLSDDARRFRLPRISPDGNLIAVQVSEGSESHDIWVFDRRTGRSPASPPTV